MTNSQFPTARKNGLVVQDMPDEVLVYDLNTNKAHCLNNTAALVWRSCDGTRSAAEIAKFINSGKDAGVSEDLVWLAIDQLNENALLETELAPKFAGESRREAIKKIGLASMVALPIIASLVAPQNAMAASSCRCTTNADCTTPPRPAGECPSTSCNSNSLCAGTPLTEKKDAKSAIISK